MPDTIRSRLDKANNMDSYLRTMITTLEYYRKLSEPKRADLLDLAIKAVSIVERDIYENELSAVGRFKEKKED